MQLDVLATWNDSVIFAGRVDERARLEDIVPGELGALVVGEFSAGDLRVSATRAGKPTFRAMPKLGRALAIACAAVGVHAGALAISRATPVDKAAEAADAMRLIQRLLAVHADAKEAKEEPPVSTSSGGTGTRAKGEEGLTEVREFGMIGLIGTGIGDAYGGIGRGVSRASKPAPTGTSADANHGVRAGEWDDNASLREFRNVLASSSAYPLQELDVSIRRVLVARDSAGKGLASCPITIADAQGNAVTLRTMATGRALLFPRAEHLVGSSVTATLRCGGNAATANISLAGDDAIVTLDGKEPRETLTTTIDVGFALDTTGSMEEEITAVKSTLRAVAARASDVRVGLVEYKDRSDPFITRVFGMTGDLPHFSTVVRSLSAWGGGDQPEAVNVGVHEAIASLEWNAAAPARLLFVIGDAPPHARDPGPRYADEARLASRAGIQVFTIAASGMDAFGQLVFRQLAQYTGGTEMFVLRGGAGPQSVGGGDPMKSCGGTQTHYTSGNLDALIAAKIDAARRALDADPLNVRGVGQDVGLSCNP